MKVGKDNLCLDLHTYVPDYSDVVPHIYEDITHSFNYKYTLKRKADDCDNEIDNMESAKQR